MPGQPAGTRISLCKEDNSHMRLLGIRLPYDDQSIKTILISSFWGFLSIEMVGKIFRESFRISKSVWIQTSDSNCQELVDTLWRGSIDELRLIGSDYFDFKPIFDDRNIFEVIRIV